MVQVVRLMVDSSNVFPSLSILFRLMCSGLSCMNLTVFLSQDKEVADSTTNIHGWAVVFNDKVVKYKGDEL